MTIASTPAYSTPSAAYKTLLTKAGQAGAGTGNNILSNLGGAFLPTAGLSGMQTGAIETQMGIIPQQTGLNNAYQSAMAGYTLGQLGIARTKLNLQGLQLSQEQGLNQYQNAIEQQQYGLTQQTFAQQIAQAQLAHRTNLQNLQNNIAQSGMQNGKGQQLAMTTLQQNYGFQLASIGRNQAMATLSQQSTLAGQKYSTQQIANAQANLGLLAESNGLSQQEVNTRLQYAISSGELQGVETIIGLYTKLGGVWTGDVESIAALGSMGGYINGVNIFSPPYTAKTAKTTGTLFNRMTEG